MPDNNKVNKLLDNLEKQTQDLYASTYHGTDINKQMFDKVTDDLSTAIQTAIKGDAQYADISNTTKLYQKVLRKTGADNFGKQSLFGGSDGKSQNDIMGFFNDSEMITSLMDTYSQTKWIKVLDDEIDMCLKYMPKLQLALDIKKDTVLCADSFSKSFISTNLKNSIFAKNDKFASNMDYIMTTYDLERKVEEWYDKASTYGEQFVYCVPYKKAFAELLSRKKNTNYAMKEIAVLENGKLGKEFKPDVQAKLDKDAYGNMSIKLTLNRTGLLENSIMAMHNAIETLRNSNICTSVYSQMLTEAGKETNDITIKMDKTIDDQLTFEDDSTADGLITANKDIKEKAIKTPGCVLRVIPRQNILPIYIEDICLGYYNIDIAIDNLVDVNTSSVSNGYNSITSMFNDTVENKDTDGDRMLKYIAGKISENIDSAFINANQNLRKEIYMMLKYNDRYNQVNNAIDMNVTFIPPEDIVHIKFNEDPRTHRGRSDLWNGLLAAKMWIMLNSTTVIGNTTRSQDKRVYYVKTMVETNVAKTLLNVVNQIKKGNFGLRQMESINNILNIVGKFNDFIIPVGPSGDSPVSFDILSGQQFDFPSEMMDRLEDSAIGSTGIPLEIVNSAMNMDFAIRYTMTNGRLLRTVLHRQGEFSDYISKIFTKIYNCEYNDNATVEVTLPPPSYLMITQGSQLVQNTVQYIDSIADVEMNGADDADRNLFRQYLLKHYLPSYIDTELIDKAKEYIEMQKSIDKTKAEISGNDNM